MIARANADYRDSQIPSLEEKMKILFATLILMLTCGANEAQASHRTEHADEDGRTCSNATLKGDYAFTLSGTRPSGPGAPLEQFVGWTITSFDGNGGGTQIGASHGSINGDSDDDSGTLTYSLNPDCSGTATLQLSHNRPLIRLWIVVSDDAKEVRAVSKAPLTNPPGPASSLTISIGRKVRVSDND
jgi:hypothetical protein